MGRINRRRRKREGKVRKDREHRRSAKSDSKMDRFSKPLFEIFSDNPDGGSKAILFSKLSWDLALAVDKDPEILDESKHILIGKFGLDREVAEELWTLILAMVERHKLMFPKMHKSLKGSERKRILRQYHRLPKRDVGLPGFPKCPQCKLFIREGRMSSHVKEEHSGPPTPSPGTLWRFKRANEGLFLMMVEKMADVSTDVDWKKLAGISEEAMDEVDEDIKRHRELVRTDGYPNALRDLSREMEERKQAGDGKDQINEWAFPPAFELMNDWKVGFEDYFYRRFFTEERCSECEQPDKDELGCRDGGADCIHDDELSRALRKKVFGALIKISEGIDEPEELQVPSEVRDKALKERELFEMIRKKS